MRAAGIRSYGGLGKVISLLIIAVGAGTGLLALNRSARFPSTDDATIDADIVHVAAAIGGRIVDLPVAENVQVAKGDLLFQSSPINRRSGKRRPILNLPRQRSRHGAARCPRNGPLRWRPATRPSVRS
jgi:multidrug efflux pump subunit AcrA (membrane-fusion protein)